MNGRPAVMRGVLLALIAVMAVAGWGCASQTDASDPDPGYYKGKQFTRKRTA